MGKNSERAYQTELLREVQERDYWHITPIPDAGAGARFGVQKPYDFVLSRKGVTNAIELKQCHGKTWGWRADNLREHQEYNLLDAHMKGCCGWIFIHHISQLSAANQKTYKVKQLDILWALSIVKYREARDQKGISSFTPLLLDEWGYRIGQGADLHNSEFICAIREYPRV